MGGDSRAGVEDQGADGKRGHGAGGKGGLQGRWGDGFAETHSGQNRHFPGFSLKTIARGSSTLLTLPSCARNKPSPCFMIADLRTNYQMAHEK